MNNSISHLHISRKLLTALIALAALSSLCEAWDADTAASFFFTLTFPLTVLLWLSVSGNSLQADDLWMLLTLAIAGVCILCSALRQSTLFCLSACKKAIMFAMTLLFYRSAARMEPEPAILRAADRITFALSVALCALVICFPAEMGFAPDRWLTLRLTNPNLAGLLLCVLYLFRLRKLSAPQRITKQLPDLAVAAALALLLWKTHSRNCILTAAAVTVCFCFLPFIRTGRRAICNAALVLPALIPPLYLAVLQIPGLPQLLRSFETAGKQLNSRQSIWSAALESILAHPLIGDYFGLAAHSGASHMHNSHLELAGFYGLPVLILTCLFLRRCLRLHSGQPLRASDLCFCATLLLGIGESAVFSGGLGIYIFTGAFLLTDNSKDTQEAHPMQSQQWELDISRLWQAIRKKLYYALIAAMLAAGLAAACTALTPAQYYAQVTFHIENDTAHNGISHSDLTAARALTESCIVVLETDSFLESVSRTAECHLSAAQLRDLVTGKQIGNTEFIKVEITADDPHLSAQLALAVESLLPERAESVLKGAVLSVTDASAQATLVTKHYALAVSFGFLVGALAAISAIVAVQVRRLREEDSAV